MLVGDAHHSLLWEFELRIARSRIVKDECIVKRYCKIVNRKMVSGGLVGGPGWVRGSYTEALLRTQGSIAVMNLHELIERDPDRAGGVAVFTGTRIPVAFLFEFLNDDQTMETFLDQHPTVSRDQARGVLGASRDLLLTLEKQLKSRSGLG
jgi:uncharacterized protein (DUF433 family)